MNVLSEAKGIVERGLASGLIRRRAAPAPSATLAEPVEERRAETARPTQVLNLGRLLVDLTNRKNEKELAFLEASNDLDAFCVAMAYIQHKNKHCENKTAVNVTELPAKARQWVARMERGDAGAYWSRGYKPGEAA